MAFAGLLITYVETLVTPALPVLRKDFQTNYANLSWVITAYIISGTASSALFGRLSDTYGKKRIYVMLTVVYAFAISAGGFAQTLSEFIIIRAIQGLGMGLFPIAFSLLYEQLPREKLALAQGIVSSTFSAGAAVGLVGGAVITQDLGWQYAYHTAIPLAFTLTILAAFVLKDTSIRKKESIDYLGVTFLSSGIVSVLVPLSQGEYWGWLSFPTLFMFSLGGILLLAFVIQESRTHMPFISMKLLKIKNIFLSNLVSIFAMGSVFFLFYSVAPMLQDPEPSGFGTSIVESGLIMLPASVLNMVFAPLAAMITTNDGPKRAILIGSMILLISYLALLTNRASIFAVLEDTIIMGIGLSFIFVGIINMVLIALPGTKAGEATGMNTVFRNIGSVMAPAIGGVLETTFTTGVMVGAIPLSQIPGGIYPVMYSFPSQTAFTYIFLIGMVFLIIGVLVTLMMDDLRVMKVNRR